MEERETSKGTKPIFLEVKGVLEVVNISGDDKDRLVGMFQTPVTQPKASPKSTSTAKDGAPTRPGAAKASEGARKAQDAKSSPKTVESAKDSASAKEAPLIEESEGKKQANGKELDDKAEGPYLRPSDSKKWMTRRGPHVSLSDDATSTDSQTRVQKVETRRKSSVTTGIPPVIDAPPDTETKVIKSKIPEEAPADLKKASGKAQQQTLVSKVGKRTLDTEDELRRAGTGELNTQSSLLSQSWSSNLGDAVSNKDPKALMKKTSMGGEKKPVEKKLMVQQTSDEKIKPQNANGKISGSAEDAPATPSAAKAASVSHAALESLNKDSKTGEAAPPKIVAPEDSQKLEEATSDQQKPGLEDKAGPKNGKVPADEKLAKAKSSVVKAGIPQMKKQASSQKFAPQPKKVPPEATDSALNLGSTTGKEPQADSGKQTVQKATGIATQKSTEISTKLQKQGSDKISAVSGTPKLEKAAMESTTEAQGESSPDSPKDSQSANVETRLLKKKSSGLLAEGKAVPKKVPLTVIKKAPVLPPKKVSPDMASQEPTKDEQVAPKEVSAKLAPKETKKDEKVAKALDNDEKRADSSHDKSDNDVELTDNKPVQKGIVDQEKKQETEKLDHEGISEKPADDKDEAKDKNKPSEPEQGTAVKEEGEVVKEDLEKAKETKDVKKPVEDGREQDKEMGEEVSVTDVTIAPAEKEDVKILTAEQISNEDNVQAINKAEELSDLPKISEEKVTKKKLKAKEGDSAKTPLKKLEETALKKGAVVKKLPAAEIKPLPSLNVAPKGEKKPETDAKKTLATKKVVAQPKGTKVATKAGSDSDSSVGKSAAEKVSASSAEVKKEAKTKLTTKTLPSKLLTKTQIGSVSSEAQSVTKQKVAGKPMLKKASKQIDKGVTEKKSDASSELKPAKLAKKLTTSFSSTMQPDTPATLADKLSAAMMKSSRELGSKLMPPSPSGASSCDDAMRAHAGHHSSSASSIASHQNGLTLLFNGRVDDGSRSEAGSSRPDLSNAPSLREAFSLSDAELENRHKGKDLTASPQSAELQHGSEAEGSKDMDGKIKIDIPPSEERTTDEVVDQSIVGIEAASDKEQITVPKWCSENGLLSSCCEKPLVAQDKVEDNIEQIVVKEDANAIDEGHEDKIQELDLAEEAKAEDTKAPKARVARHIPSDYCFERKLEALTHKGSVPIRMALPESPFISDVVSKAVRHSLSRELWRSALKNKHSNQQNNEASNGQLCGLCCSPNIRQEQ